MMPGPTIVRKCPHCEQSVAQDSLASGNTIGATFWSDGRMIAPMLPDSLDLVKCPKCMKLFWFNKSIKVGELPPFSQSNDIEPTALEYIRYAEASKLPKKLAKYIRIRAWWKANDYFRDITPESEEAPPDPADKLPEPDFRNNLEALAKLLDLNICQDRIMAI
jgi:hypothetical protein